MIGAAVAHGTTDNKLRFSDTMSPQSAVGGFAPKPRNASALTSSSTKDTGGPARRRVRFLVDAQPPARLARSLSSAGHDALHTTEHAGRRRTTVGNSGKQPKLMTAAGDPGSAITPRRPPGRTTSVDSAARIG